MRQLTTIYANRLDPVDIIFFNCTRNQVMALQDNCLASRIPVGSDSIVRDPDSVLTGAAMDGRIEHFGTKQVRYQHEHQTTAITLWSG